MSIPYCPKFLPNLFDNQPNEPARDPDWPDDDDYRECCGVWMNGDEQVINVTPIMLRNSYGSRREFDSEFPYPDDCIEPIPPQCVPGYEEPDEPDWKAEAVERYPRVTEWD